MADNISQKRQAQPEFGTISEKIYLSRQPKSVTKSFRLYLVPILSVGLFILLLLKPTLPSMHSYFSLLDELKTARVELKLREENLAYIQGLQVQESGVQADLLNEIEKIIPTAKTEVIEFERKVSGYAEIYNIEIEEVTVGEKILLENKGVPKPGEEEAETTFELPLVQIPLTFSLKGGLDNIKSMLAELYQGEDFIVISEMRLDIEDNIAEATLVLSKYQFLNFKSPSEERAALDSIDVKTPINQNVLDFVKRKSETI